MCSYGVVCVRYDLMEFAMLIEAISVCADYVC